MCNKYFDLKGNEIFPSLLKEKFRDIPLDRWISLNPVLPSEVKDMYEVNLLGQFRKITTGKVWLPKDLIRCDGVYPNIKFTNHSINFIKEMKVHRLLALLFLENPNPKKKKVVDHLDRDINNFNLSNLRWATVSENRLNTNPYISRYIYAVFDKYNNFIKYIPFNDKWCKEHRQSIGDSIRNGKLYNNVRWVKIDTVLESYISEIGGYTGDDFIYESPRFPGKVFCNSNGILKINNRILVGGKKAEVNEYLTVRIDNENYQTHRIVAECKEGIILGKDNKLIVDHKDTIRYNNSFDNLNITTYAGNANNENSISKRSIQLSMINLETFEIEGYYISARKAAIAMGNVAKKKEILNCAKGILKYSCGKLWAIKDQEKERIELYKTQLKESKSTNKVPNGYWNSHKEECIKLGKTFRTRKEFSRKEGGAFQAAEKNGWLDEILPKQTTRKWTKETCQEAASKFSSRTKFCREQSGAYNVSLKNGWLDEFFPTKD